MAKDKTILIAKLLSAHGIQGNMHILSFAGNPDDIENYQMFDGKGRNYKIKIIGTSSKNRDGNIFIAKIDNIKDRNQADLLVNTELFINRDQFKEANDNEFYYVDLIGLEAVSSDGKKLGKVVDVNDFGAGTIIEVEFDKFEKKYDQFQSFSFTNQIIPEVNIKKGYLVINLPETVEIK